MFSKINNATLQLIKAKKNKKKNLKINKVIIILD